MKLYQTCNYSIDLILKMKYDREKSYETANKVNELGQTRMRAFLFYNEDVSNV